LVKRGFGLIVVCDGFSQHRAPDIGFHDNPSARSEKGADKLKR
jgi:hypothetical protein